jgi:parallel beta-helix repeat protein
MKKIFSILLALALVLGFSVVTATPVAAATLEVGSGKTYATIQAAVDAASTFDTILVYTGTYNENVVVWQDVTVKSAVKHGAVVVGQDVGTYASWAWDVFRVIADGVTVEGFDIRMYTPPGYPTMPGGWNGHDGVAVKASDVTVKDNRITQPGAPNPFTGWVPATGAAISAIGGALTGVTIEGNEIYHTTGTGLYIYDTDDSEFQNNKIEETQYTGILLWGGSSNNDITCNQIKDCGTQWNSDDGIRFGGNAQNNRATCNTITGSSHDGIRNVASASGNVANHNSIYGNTGYGLNNQNTGITFDAENNWWGCDAGPGAAGCDTVSANVDYDPWVTASSVATATGTGTASFATACGSISGLTSVPEGSLPTAGKPDLNFPHGFFSFDITGLTPGDTVTVTIILPPGPTPTQYWKYGPTVANPTPHWYQLPMTVVGPSNVIRITLVDGGLGDDDGDDNGTIVDDGGPGNPGPAPAVVGWETYPTNKVRVFLPWIALLAAIAAGVSLLILRRRRTQS